MQEKTNYDLDFRRTISLPYHGNISYSVDRILADFGISNRFRIDNKVDKFITLAKDSLKTLQCSNVVYKISCLNCEKIYIRQTGRLLETRISEHKKNINLNPKYHNVVIKYRLDKKHDFNWDNIKILHKEQNYYKRILVEMFHIKKEQKNCLNVITDLKDYKI